MTVVYVVNDYEKSSSKISILSANIATVHELIYREIEVFLIINHSSFLSISSESLLVIWEKCFLFRYPAMFNLNIKALCDYILQIVAAFSCSPLKIFKSFLCTQHFHLLINQISYAIDFTGSRI